MPGKFTFLLTIVLLLNQSISAQRYLDTHTELNSRLFTLEFNGRVLLAGANDSFLRSFGDDAGMRIHNYPILDGRRLLLKGNKNLVLYNGQVYLVLGRDTASAPLFLYRFNGTGFTRVTSSGSILSELIVSGSKLYFLSLSGSDVRLNSYNGSTVSHIPGGSLPATGSHQLLKAGNFLYLIRGIFGSPYTIKRTDGLSIITLPPYDFDEGNLQIYAAGTSAYIQAGNFKLAYFNGSTISTVLNLEGSSSASLTNAAVWRDDLYFFVRRSVPEASTRMYRVNAGVITEIGLPAGSVIPRVDAPTVYDDALYFTISYGETDKRVLRYATTGFSDFFTIPTYTYGGSVFDRRGNLIIQPAFLNDRFAYEYKDSEFTQLIAPAGHLLGPYLGSTECQYHLWLSYKLDTVGSPSYRHYLLREKSDCIPDTTSPPETPMLAIPEHFYNFENVKLDVWGIDRGWCWNEIVFDWKINPCGFPDPPCPDPVYNLSMYNKNNKLAWQEKIDKPVNLGIPLKDDQPYVAKLIHQKTKKDLVIFTDDLVAKGFESIRLYMRPGDKFFKIEANTDKAASIPLKVELLGSKGEILWNKEFMAPFSEQIFDKVQTPGQTFRFSTPGSLSKSGNANLTVFPNPSNGHLNLKVISDKTYTEALLSISTLTGQKILDRKINLPFSQQIKLNNIKPGIYLIRVISGKDVVSRILKVQ